LLRQTAPSTWKPSAVVNRRPEIQPTTPFAMVGGIDNVGHIEVVAAVDGLRRANQNEWSSNEQYAIPVPAPFLRDREKLDCRTVRKASNCCITAPPPNSMTTSASKINGTV